ncbi:MAG: Rieske (2Fe-2S) iron-sulfur domain protein [halophilic archaeon J07HB67]|jgi:Ferredoxin subunits of nitrite reductase and ring-hydroxylating dioxygenases|nr:MAG: Rieske (2Fe-2S) iron-sulfur domain protein [halophilic archaeon J07HB67]
MDNATELTTVSALPDDDSYLFTVSGPSGLEEEVILVRTDAGLEDGERATADGDDTPPVRAWKNFCMHEPDQAFDRGGDVGAAIREGQVICPRHGSLFDLDSGDCDNGPAAGQSMVEVTVTVTDGAVYLTDDNLTFEHEGGLDDDDGMPSSTSHLGL